MNDEERGAIEKLISQSPLETLFPGLEGIGSKNVDLLDAAYWVKGCSSLGRLRFAVLLRVENAGERKLSLIDIKEGVTAAAPRSPNVVMPSDNAVRVVSGARALSPNLGNRMIAARLLERAVVIRELMPQDLKIDMQRLNGDEAASIARYLAGIVGRAHGRQMDLETRNAWRTAVGKRRKARLDAPSWLWLSVVDLMGAHEAAYLEHCRRYALSQAA